MSEKKLHNLVLKICTVLIKRIKNLENNPVIKITIYIYNYQTQLPQPFHAAIQ